MDDAAFFAQLPNALVDPIPGIAGSHHRGKVRDTYRRGNQLLLVASDRLSAFDRILTSIPFKGQLLTQLSAHWFEHTADLVPNHVIDIPHPNACIARAATPFPVEFVVRGYLAGSLWRDVQAGRDPYGLQLPANLRRDEALSEPRLTPSTKAPSGEHDQPCSKAELLASGAISEAHYRQAEAYALALFARGQALAAQRGLLLVDTKYEFGLADGEVLLIDEIHTPDSSRYWEAAEYRARFERGEAQRMFDKENIRQWLLAQGFSGHGEAPTIPDRLRIDLAKTYAEAFERLTGKPALLSVGSPAASLAPRLKALGWMAA